ncbi:MAG TPA: mannose-6-phosphate isomerase, class I [Pseudogracilibacillus sp.]|nr:mannose-6-phosphate isomerase, class I [Pseudogracilibacillus sp.]
MSDKLIFLKPVFKEKIWGGDKLNTIYHYDIPSNKTGEAWIISAHEHGSSLVENGPHKDKSLSDLWENERHLFNRSETDDNAYPLLVKIIDANDDLSVQVHPDDTYAQEKEGVPFGKTECWYILDADEDSTIILGHYAKTKEELTNLIDTGKWEDLLQEVPVKKGDFFYVPSGTIHAIGANVVILEIQQSSDITYRVYDYDRKDDQGDKRELHLDKAKEVTQVPHQMMKGQAKKEETSDYTIEQLIQEQYFTVSHWNIHGSLIYDMKEDYLQVNVLEGKAKLIIDNEEITIEAGQHFIIPHTVEQFVIKGDINMMVSHVTK